MAAAGEPVYSPPGQGVIGTWMYGPIPIWLFQPATWMPDISSASLMAGAINILFQLTAIAIACTVWPAKFLNSGHRLAAFLIVVAAWPEAAWRFIQADNYAVAFGLLSACCLIRIREKPIYGWCAALSAAMAVACKQTSLGIPLAQFAWIATTQPRQIIRDQALRLVAASAGIVIVSLLAFDPAGLWYNLVRLPSLIPLTDQSSKRLLDLLPLLSVHWVLPPLILLMARKLPCPAGGLRMVWFLWIFSLPLGVISLLKAGGTINSLQGLQLVLPALALAAVTWLASRTWLKLLPAILASVLLGIRLLILPHMPVRPLTLHLSEGVALARANPDSLWFPWNPMVTYYAEGKIFHAEDGFYVRNLANQPVSYVHARKYLPAHFSGIAEQRGLNGWGISETMLVLPLNEQGAGFFWRVRTSKAQSQISTP
jgi:hypothetical protein